MKYPGSLSAVPSGASAGEHASEAARAAHLDAGRTQGC